jgi:hypothetical protein
LRSIREDRRGVSAVIVVVLSLVIVVVIATDVFLWNFEMNRLDWEKTQENIDIADVSSINLTRSSWFTAQREYGIIVGSRSSGTYVDTHSASDGNWETFVEEPRPPLYRFDLNGTFLLDISAFPLDSISSVEIQLRFRVSDTNENWFVEAYNWGVRAYDDNGFNVTSGHAPTGGWDIYAVNLTDAWENYVLDDGAMYVKLGEEGDDAVRTSVDIDFWGVRAVVRGTVFTFRNRGPLTCHVVSLWIVNSVDHKRYDVSIFINSGTTEIYARPDISLSNGEHVIKAVTERGNTAVYSVGSE